MVKRRTLRMTVDTKMLAKAMTINCVRNTILEQYHLQGQLSDADMMAFNKVVVNRIYTFLDCLNNRSATERNLFLAKMVATSEAFTAKWDDLEFDGDLWQGVQAHLEKMRQIQRMKDEEKGCQSDDRPGQEVRLAARRSR